jgi:hypothetical protein
MYIGFIQPATWKKSHDSFVLEQFDTLVDYKKGEGFF